MRKFIAFTALTLVANSGIAQVEDTTVYEEVIIQRNRLEIPVNQATRNIEILTHEEIKKLPARTVNELLAYVGGVDIRQRGPFGGQADISIDGGSFEQTLVLINGVKLLDAQTAHNMMNIPIPLDAIDRIEVLRGPAARVYGINSLTGAINIVTKSEANSFVAVNTFAGSSFEERDSLEGDGIYGGGGIQLTGNFNTKKQNHLIALSQDLSNGQRYNTGQQNSRFFYAGKHKVNQNHEIEWMGGYTYNDFGANGFYAAPGDINSHETVETTLLSLSSTHQFGKVKITPRISNRYNEDDYRYLGKDIDIARSKHYANAFMAEVNASLETKIGDFGLGAESRFDEINSSNIGEHQRDNYGISAEYRKILWRKLIATAGTYVNYNTNYGWQAYPGVDLGYRISPHWKVSASVGTGQRIPSFTDLYLNQAPANVGNPNILPEDAMAYEANIDYKKKNFRAKGGYFYRSITNYIDWVRDLPTDPYSPVNIGENLVHGLYANISQQFQIKQHKIGYKVSYTHLDPSYKSDNGIQSKYILESLRHQLIVGVNYAYGNFSIQANNRFIERELNSPYNLLSFRANYDINNFSVYADMSNLLNEQYVEAGAVPMPPRWFTLGVRYKWSK
ncbi:TonB-dependent receptor plug domain-containing protein [Brumimicrobium aurantiacum]|uniref:TonB-dependent receptor n=1 Tax=Brumimicrobium aurantiacum TaxID=1737063 RepID=A0A3E1F149_9FLAO|nr:TonB-dependent receptor [Brumimicrobium aurantiacum]RFC55552.1 TonB-dependent receptor [Brumimicrobium aurantiacum]